MRVQVLPLAAALVLLSACAQASGSGSGSPSGDPAGGSTPAADALAISIDPGDGSPAEEYTLTCGGTDEGNLPDAAGACTRLAAMDEPFAPLPADSMCTEQYGGPQTARITGTWGGLPVELDLSRVDGCHIGQWDGLGMLLPGPVGVDPPA